VSIVDDEALGERILEIEVRGKRGVGYCKSMPGAVRPFERLKARNAARAAEKARKEGSDGHTVRNGHEPNPTDLIFPKTHRELFNAVLDEEGLKLDRDGRLRTPIACGTPTSASA
jgi:hypothetical protein